MKSNYKILLISFYNDEAYGLRLLHSILHHQGYDVKMLFLKKPIQNSFAGQLNNVTDEEKDILSSFIKNYDPNIIGFSLVSSNFSLYKRIYNHIRGLGDFKVVVGGWQASLNPEETILYSDILVIGEGEEAFQELVDKLYRNQSIDDVRNTWIRKGKKTINSPLRPLIADLSAFPIPIFENESSYYIENNKITHKEPYFENSRYGIMIGRGCPYNCTYCSNSYMAKNVYCGKWSKIRYRDIAHVMIELNEVKRKLLNVNRINFYDEVFMPQKAWADYFVERYKNEIALPFYCMFYPGTCKEETATILKEAGLAGVWLGVQSGSERVRKEVFKRHYSNDIIKRQVEIFHRYNIGIKYDFILDNPFETFEESLESIKLMLELPEPFSVNLFSLKYFPNTEITAMALEAGIISDKSMNDHLETDHQNYLVTKGHKSINNDFINSMATYVSYLASKSKMKSENKQINELIDDFRRKNDLTRIKKVISQIKT